MANPLYSPLSNGRKEIRVIDIISSLEDDFACRLETISLVLAQDSAAPFVALSYVWGNAQDTTPITVNGTTVAVTKTLAFALKHVKSHWETVFPDREPSSFRIWADGLCINQQDTDERNDQVKMMADIYRTAEAVFASVHHEDPVTIGLGLMTVHAINSISDSLDEGESMWPRGREEWPDLFSDPPSETQPGPGMEEPGANAGGKGTFDEYLAKFGHDGMDLDSKAELWIQWNGSPVGIDEHGDPTFKANSSWSSLIEFFRADNWRRVWIYQEVVLSRDLFFFCGTHGTVSKDELEELSARLREEYGIFATVGHDVDHGAGSLPIWLRLIFVNSDHYPIFAFLAARSWVESEHPAGSFLQGPQTPQVERQVHVSQTLLMNSMDATNPKDYFYGFLGVNGLDMPVDYGKSLKEICRDFAIAWWQLSHHGASLNDALSFLHFAGLERMWQPSCDEEDNTPYLEQLPSWAPRYNSSHRPSINEPVDDVYKADTNLPPYVSALLPASDDENDRDVLLAGGVIFGKVESVGPSFTVESKSVFTWVCDLLARHEQVGLPGRAMPTLRAIFRTFEFDYSDYKCDQVETINRARMFLNYLVKLMELVSVDADIGKQRLVQLGLPPGSADPDYAAAIQRIFYRYGRPLESLPSPNRSVDSDTWIWSQQVRDNYDFVMAEVGIAPSGGTQLAQIPRCSRRGDAICVLRGFKYPVVLRPTEMGDGSWLYVGQAFVLDAMEGEVATLWDNVEDVMQPIRIR
ncbi:Heterokaryon incompatibility protein (HET) domain containing protein [Rhypophila sp. PSN 637]